MAAQFFSVVCMIVQLQKVKKMTIELLLEVTTSEVKTVVAGVLREVREESLKKKSAGKVISSKEQQKILGK